MWVYFTFTTGIKMQKTIYVYIHTAGKIYVIGGASHGSLLINKPLYNL